MTPSTLELYTDRFYLRPLELTDIDIAIELFTDKDVVRYIGGKTHTPKELEEQMHTSIRRCAHGAIGIWCVTDRETGEKYGTSILLPLPIEEEDTDWDLVVGDDLPDAEIEVGYILKKSAWGKGIATEVTLRLLGFAFEETALEEVAACTDDDNFASQHVLKKAGLEYIGIQPVYAETGPKFRITRQQWLDQKNGRIRHDNTSPPE